MQPTLVILAAGIGSRYGGIKQLDGFGPYGERIIDYTVYDAIKAGYGKIVFVIRKAIEADFNEAILKKWEGKIPVEVVFQELDSLPKGYDVPKGREKPWGTAHAVWMTEKVVNEPFAIVNADDFYGRVSLEVACNYLKEIDNNQHAGCLVGYQLDNTLTNNGSVSRGICGSNNQGNLTEIVERTKIYKEEGTIYFEENDTKSPLSPQTLVSMNLMGFSSKVFEVIAAGFDTIYKQSATNLKVEYYIPTVLNELIKSGVKAPVLPTTDQWFGVTYSEDKAWVKEQLAALHMVGAYPSDLWA
jgi:dTDP-glucose pyrophosphorylase